MQKIEVQTIKFILVVLLTLFPSICHGNETQELSTSNVPEISDIDKIEAKEIRSLEIDENQNNTEIENGQQSVTRDNIPRCEDMPVDWRGCNKSMCKSSHGLGHVYRNFTGMDEDESCRYLEYFKGYGVMECLVPNEHLGTLDELWDDDTHTLTAHNHKNRDEESRQKVEQHIDLHCVLKGEKEIRDDLVVLPANKRIAPHHLEYDVIHNEHINLPLNQGGDSKNTSTGQKG